MAKRGKKKCVLVVGRGRLPCDVAKALGETGGWGRIELALGEAAPSVPPAHSLDLLARGASRRLAQLAADVDPDLVVLLWASDGPDLPARSGRFEAAAAEAVKAGLERWLDGGGRLGGLIALSSTAVYGVARTSPLLFNEASPPAAVATDTPFGRWVEELRQAESLLSAFGRERSLAVGLLRAATVVAAPSGGSIGAYLDSTVVLRVAGHDPCLQLLHYRDLVTAIVASCGLNPDGALNIVGRGTVPLSRVVALAGRLAVPLPAFLARRLAPPALGVERMCWRSLADGRRSLQVLGIEPRYSSEDALREAVAGRGGDGPGV